jgi:hypothetical protein
MKNNTQISSKFKFLTSLMEAHKNEKCHELTEASNSLLKFVNETYTKLNFNYFCDLVSEAFAKAWFSF